MAVKGKSPEPIEIQGFFMVAEEGFEPTTFGL
jgi:hypothetical protein